MFVQCDCGGGEPGGTRSWYSRACRALLLHFSRSREDESLANRGRVSGVRGTQSVQYCVAQRVIIALREFANPESLDNDLCGAILTLELSCRLASHQHLWGIAAKMEAVISCEDNDQQQDG